MWSSRIIETYLSWILYENLPARLRVYTPAEPKILVYMVPSFCEVPGRW